jgi:hypothetical protein
MPDRPLPPPGSPLLEDKANAPSSDVRARVKWTYGDLSAFEDTVDFNMTTQTGLFRKKIGTLQKVFPYADLDVVSVMTEADGITIILHPRGGEAQPCQGCSDSKDVDAFVEAVQQRGVTVERVAAPVPNQIPERRNEVRVKSYLTERDYQKDARKLIRKGWRIEGQSSKERDTAIGRTFVKTALTGVVGLIVMGRSKKGDTITVTWVR